MAMGPVLGGRSVDQKQTRTKEQWKTLCCFFWVQLCFRAACLPHALALAISSALIFAPVLSSSSASVLLVFLLLSPWPSPLLFPLLWFCGRDQVSLPFCLSFFCFLFCSFSCFIQFLVPLFLFFFYLSSGFLLYSSPCSVSVIKFWSRSSGFSSGFPLAFSSALFFVLVQCSTSAYICFLLSLCCSFLVRL